MSIAMINFIKSIPACISPGSGKNGSTVAVSDHTSSVLCVLILTVLISTILMIVIVPGYKCTVSSQSSPLPRGSSLDHRLQVRSEHLSWSPHPLCPGVWSDRSQADQQTGGGAHVQGGDHSQRRFSAGSTPPLPQPVLQLLYSRDLAPQPVNCKCSQGWYEELSLRLSHCLTKCLTFN